MRVHGVTAGPLFPDEGPRGGGCCAAPAGSRSRWWAWSWSHSSSRSWRATALAVDLALWLKNGKPWVAIRLLAFGWWFLFAEARVLLAMLAIRLSTSYGSDRRRRRPYGLRIHWMSSHIGGARTGWGFAS